MSIEYLLMSIQALHKTCFDLKELYSTVFLDPKTAVHGNKLNIFIILFKLMTV